MRQLSLAIVFCCAAWSCAASAIASSNLHWLWPPTETNAIKPLDGSLLLPTVVTAARFGAGLSNDTRHESVPAAPELSNGVMQAVPPMAEGEVPLPRPRVEHVVPNVPIEEVCDKLASAAETHQLPVPFFIRLIWQESRFDPGAISPMGAQGVAQFMPATAAAMGLKNPFNPLEALPFSARLLRELIGQFGNLGLAAAAYNAGPKKIFDWLARRGKLPEETRNYVMNITGHAAERWRFTKPGRLALDVPKRAPCRGASNVAYLVEVPAPPPVAKMKKKPARARLLANGKTGRGKTGQRRSTAARSTPGKVSAARKGGTAKAAERSLSLIARASAARKGAKRKRTQTAAKH
jgi:hypothetical protein